MILAVPERKSMSEWVASYGSSPAEVPLQAMALLVAVVIIRVLPQQRGVCDGQPKCAVCIT